MTQPTGSPDPYAYDPYAAQAQQRDAQQGLSYQPSPQQWYGYASQPYSAYGPPTYHRPAWKIALAVVFFLIAGLGLLGSLVTLANPSASTSGDAAESVGYRIGQLIGVLLLVVLPAVIGYLLVRTPKRYRSGRG